MLTTELVALIRTLPDATFFEETIVQHYQKEQVKVEELISDFFHWVNFKSKIADKNSKKYVCIVPSYDMIYWKSFFRVYIDTFEIPFRTLRKELIEWVLMSYESFGPEYIMNMSYDILMQLAHLEPKDIPDALECVENIILVSNSKLKDSTKSNQDTATFEKQIKEHVSKLKDSMLSGDEGSIRRVDCGDSQTDT